MCDYTPTDEHAVKLFQGIQKRDKISLSRAITIVESAAEQHQKIANELLKLCLPYQGKAFRISITGIPGAGKSTFIEALGKLMVNEGFHLAVLAVDPTSTISKGSILGDKTRMETLSREDNVFIRPSPNRGMLGGITKSTYEIMLLFDAAGYDYMIVETVGVGQSEIFIRLMVDCFILLLIAGAGDELQIFKKGITEIADIILINKADGSNQQVATKYAEEMKRAIHFLALEKSTWKTPVFPISAKSMWNINRVWDTIKSFQQQIKASEDLKQRSNTLKVDWFRFLLKERVVETFFSNPQIKTEIERLEKMILNDSLSIYEAINQALKKLEDNS
ncbi:MAG: methylmalonyl Co-A mutase-associated GTPase MeaB [bacterium]|nr:methylmalonyl Co-A mutase-associated GTPase MeaB [bacterium]